MFGSKWVLRALASMPHHSGVWWLLLWMLGEWSIVRFGSNAPLQWCMVFTDSGAGLVRTSHGSMKFGTACMAPLLYHVGLPLKCWLATLHYIRLSKTPPIVQSPLHCPKSKAPNCPEVPQSTWLGLWRPNFSHFGWEMTKIWGVGLTCTLSEWSAHHCKAKHAMLKYW